MSRGTALRTFPQAIDKCTMSSVVSLIGVNCGGVVREKAEARVPGRKSGGGGGGRRRKIRKGVEKEVKGEEKEK